MAEEKPETDESASKQQHNNKIQELVEQLIQNLDPNGNTSADKNAVSAQDFNHHLEKIEDLDQEIEKLLSLYDFEANDLSKLQNILILLLTKYFASTKNKLSKKEIEQIVKKEIAGMGDLILQQYTNLLQSYKKPLKAKQNIEALEHHNFAKQQLKRLIKGFMVYEIYKVMSPRRIAGETKLDNFINNVMFRHDVKYAMKFAGGSKSDIASYSPNVKNTLKRQNVKNANLLGR